MIMGNGLSILQLSKALPTLYSHCLLIFTFSLKAKQNKQELYNHLNLTFGATKKKKKGEKKNWQYVSATESLSCLVAFPVLFHFPLYPLLHSTLPFPLPRA